MTTPKGAREAVDDAIPEPELPTYNEDGVDLTLIRWMLSMTPRERLEWAETSANSIERLTGANRRA